MRARLLLTRGEGAALDALTGAFLAGAIARFLGAPPIWAGAGLAVGLLVGLRWTTTRAARAIESSRRELLHALTAWLEGAGGALRPQLERWLVARVKVPLMKGGLARAGVAAALCLLARAPAPVATPELVQEIRPPAPDTIEARIHIEPPRYSGRPAFSSAGPEVEALRGSTVTLSFTSGSSTLKLSEPGREERTVTLTPEPFVLDRSRTLRVTRADERARLVIELKARADEPPIVEILSPSADQVVTSAPAPVVVKAVATDDLGVATASLHYTLAQGTGESMHFKSGTIAARTETSASGTTITARVSPTGLGMAAGDTLVYWAEATDTNAFDGPSRSRSTARLLRWDVPVAQMTGGTAAIVPSPRSLLTQRELLARTEKLVRRGLRGKALEEASIDLATDQRALRLSFSQVLGAEQGDALALDVDEKEAAETSDTHARALLAKAVSAMWESESELSVIHPQSSLAPQRAAVKALDEAFQLVRLSLRPLAQPDKPVDEGRRLTGSTKGLVPRIGTLPAPPEPDPRLVAAALDLIGASARGLDAAEAKSLGDLVWALPAREGVPTAELAAALYGATDGPSRANAARLAGEALARFVRPAHLLVPAQDPSGAQILSRVPLLYSR